MCRGRRPGEVGWGAGGEIWGRPGRGHLPLPEPGEPPRIPAPPRTAHSVVAREAASAGGPRGWGVGDSTLACNRGDARQSAGGLGSEPRAAALADPGIPGAAGATRGTERQSRWSSGCGAEAGGRRKGRWQGKEKPGSDAGGVQRSAGEHRKHLGCGPQSLEGRASSCASP